MVTQNTSELENKICSMYILILQTNTYLSLKHIQTPKHTQNMDKICFKKYLKDVI